MKLTLHKIFPASGYRSALLSYPAVMVLMCVEMAVMVHNHYGEILGGDSYSYVDAMESLRAGIPDLYRTPVYPLWLMLIEWIFGADNIGAANQLLQIPIALAGGWFFMRVAGKFTFGRPRATFWLTAVFCLVPEWNLWVAYTQTETMALTGTVIMLWWLVRDLPAAPTMRSAITASVWLVLLVLLRPVMICYIPAVAIYWLLLWKRKPRRNVICGMASIAASVLIVAGYMNWFQRSHGMYYLSAVSQWNNFHLLGSAKLLDPSLTSNPHLQEFVREAIKVSRPESPGSDILMVYLLPDVTPEMPIEDIDSLINRGISQNKAAVTKLIWDRFRIQICPMPVLSTSWESPYGLFEAVIRPVMGLYFIFLGVAGIWLVWLWTRRVRPPGAWLCWLLCMSLAGASVAGAQYDWPRLIMPTVPAALILGYQMLSYLRPVNK